MAEPPDGSERVGDDPQPAQQHRPHRGRLTERVDHAPAHDALPHEHEQMHRQLADKLVNGGILKASELGQITVEREEDEKQAAPPVSSGPQGERQAQQTGH